MNTESRDLVLSEVGHLAPAVADLGQAFSRIAIARDLSHREAMSTVAILLGTLVATDDSEHARERHMMMADILVRVIVGKLVPELPT